MIPIRMEVLPFLIATAVVFGLPACLLALRKRRHAGKIMTAFLLPALVLAAYLLYFFRDPERVPPQEPNAVLAAADGRIASITNIHEAAYIKADCVRISIFLSLFDVHVNRAPISGESTFLGYFPGKRFFTFDEKSSTFNQHNKILIKGDNTQCLIAQIVGPVCRRVVYWPDHDNPVPIAAGDRIGMMKFGSRLDMYLPASNTAILVKPGQFVRAGETVLARIIDAGLQPAEDDKHETEKGQAP